MLCYSIAFGVLFGWKRQENVEEAGDSSTDPAAKSFPGPFFKARSVADSPRFFAATESLL